MYSILLFDLDGTLSDPLEGIARSINHALETHGLEPRALAELARFVGPPLDQSFERLTGIANRQTIVSLVGAYRERYLDMGYAENTLYPGVAEVLETLRKARKAMALCTSKSEPATVKILERFELSQHFAFLSCGDIGIAKWQQIAGLMATCKVQRTAIMIGDRAVDIEAGRRNGLATGAVTWGYGSRGELSLGRPDRWFAAPTDWLALQTHRSTVQSP